MKKVASHALGCKVNQYESEAIAELFAKEGYEIVDIESVADVYIINTCTVTNFGDKKSRQLIRKVKRKNPDSIVVVVGCYAQVAPEEVMKIEGVNIVVGTKGKSEIVSLVEKYKNENEIALNNVTNVSSEREYEEMSIERLSNRTRAYLKIQDGCSQFCSYCIIPYARGPVRSRKPEEILSEVLKLSENGFKEVVLAGIHVTSYGKDLKNINLLDLIKMVHGVSGIERIRFSSFEPGIITEAFLQEIVKLNKVCHHFHLSLQSGCEKTLKMMNRKYSAEEYYNAVLLLRRYMPDVALTTDIIVGFPGETEEDFTESYNFARKIGFSKIHVFPYSPKEGTKAFGMKGQVQNSIKSVRSKKLIELSEKSSVDFMKKQLGKNLLVLFEEETENGIFEGHTSNYIKVLTSTDKNIKNKLINVKIIGYEKDYILGELV